MRSSYRSLFSAKGAPNTNDMMRDESIKLDRFDYSNNFESSQFPLKELQRSLSKKVIITLDVPRFYTMQPFLTLLFQNKVSEIFPDPSSKRRKIKKVKKKVKKQPNILDIGKNTYTTSIISLTLLL